MIENRWIIEWLNYWIEDANQAKKNRICLVGDSITRQYRKMMNRILRSEEYVVDLITMSYSMLDDRLTEELVHYFEGIGYQYKYIVLHIGTHHGFWFQCKTDRIYFERYKNQLAKLCKLLSDYCDSIITVGGTPENEEMSSSNEEILVRNDILQKVSEENGYPYLNFYQVMKNTNYGYIDHCHYVQSANEYMANRVIETIFGKTRNDVLNMKDTLKEFTRAIDDTAGLFI